VSGSLLSKRIPLDHSCALQASATALLIASASPLLLSLTEDAIAHLTLTPTPTPTSKAKQSKEQRTQGGRTGSNNQMERKKENNRKGNTKALVPLSTRAQKRRESTSYFEHLQRRCSIILTIQVFSLFYFFSNPTHKTKIGIANR